MHKPVAFAERIAPWYLFGMASVMIFSGIAPMRSYSASRDTGAKITKSNPLRTENQHKTKRLAWDQNVGAEPRRGMYQRLFHVRATAYVPQSIGREGGRFTATQRDGQATHGIAVDPGIIPLGTRLWIPGYGHAIADDTGGMIRGHRIDVRLQEIDRLSKWGVRDMRVYVLSDPQ